MIKDRVALPGDLFVQRCEFPGSRMAGRASEVNGGHLTGAALDVHENEGEGVRSPLADLPNVVLTPHIGSMAVEVQAEIGKRVLEIVEGFRCR